MLSEFILYDLLVKRLREFFSGVKGFVEIPTQQHLSILAACEDPETISSFIFSGVTWPQIQTGQMTLEGVLLSNPGLKGVFCSTTSYRDEPFPIEGRHDKIFPMFEFESHGDVNDLIAMEAEFLDFMGFPMAISAQYEDMCIHVGAEILDAEHETRMWKDFGPSISLESFPRRTDPFWNMKHAGHENYAKVDVILYGMETIGSAERSCNVEEMRSDFLTISDGKYAKLLFASFGKERVMAEMDEYLRHEMFPRYGGGMGLTRLARAWKLLHQSC